MDLGGSKTVLALGDREGRVRMRRRRPTEPSGEPGRDIARLLDDARALLREAGVTPAELSAVGISAPGPLDRARGAVVGPPNLPGWRDVPLRDALAEGLGLPVHLENDANAAALAEWRFGAGRGFDDLVYLTMSTGIGAGLVLGGELYTGSFGNAGELGHLPIEWDGELCACGQRGCLEAYVGGAAWTRRLRACTPAGSRVAALAGDSAVKPEHVVAAAGEGDPFACEEIERFNRYLVRGLTALVFTFAPQAIVLGTIVAAAGEGLCLDPVRTDLAARVWPLLGRGLVVRAAELGERLPELAGLCVAFPEA
ncbi:MAG: ROK family protein [Myxococcota bacterium]|nr:ROK family protein [Myxococcota bacterium]MDP7074271.1 ROK family protein [Myxococcota bacterium]MDP7300942.1 ROK family protein [Myxococcota bacterium]MDP7431115.1 ROK family protein [Myxococcota bacterium]